MRFVVYLRVSTSRQGRSGLGLEAQQQQVNAYARSIGAKVLETFTEVESGKDCSRPKLAAALAACRLRQATLVIAKLDRLARDAAFLLGLQKDLQRHGLRFVAADMPEANEMTVGIMAVVAQAERRMIADRTKAALAAARARGVKLGKPGNLSEQAKGRKYSAQVRRAKAEEKAQDLEPIIADLRENGAASLRQLAEGLNARGYRTARGREWHSMSVLRVLERLSA
jgi:DNA invertase Pin-like site-specific DNA recombinase